MQPRARVVLPVLAATLSSTIIISLSATGQTPTRVTMKTVKTFETTFTEKINDAIRSEPAAQSTFATQKCAKDFVAERIYKTKESPTAGPKPCGEFSLGEKQDIRNRLHLRLDEVYLKKLPLEEVVDGRTDAAWFGIRLFLVKNLRETK